MQSCLAGLGQHRREGLAFSTVEWIGSRNAASSTCRGPPLDRKSRAVPGSRAGAHGEPMRASTTVCCANARARKDDGLGGAASGAGQRTVGRMTRPRGTSGGEAPASHVQLYVGNNAGHGLGGPCRARFKGQAMGSAGNDRNAFRSTMEQARRPRETAVDTGGGRTSTAAHRASVQCPRNGGGFGWRLQPKRRGQISFERACHRDDIKALLPFIRPLVSTGKKPFHSRHVSPSPRSICSATGVSLQICARPRSGNTFSTQCHWIYSAVSLE